MPAPAACARLTLASPTSSAAASAIASHLGLVVDQRREDQAEIHFGRRAEAAATLVAMRRMPCSTKVIVSRFIVRTVPPSVAVCGITL